MMQENERKAFVFACIDKAVQAGISKLSIQDGDFSLTIENQPCTVQPQLIQPAMQENHTSVQTEEPEGFVVKAPLVGTFYASSAPDEPPMVQPGDVVKKGDQLCIIEAMKVMNSIESPCDGVVTRVMAENGGLVEYQQPLFVIKENA